MTNLGGVFNNPLISKYLELHPEYNNYSENKIISLIVNDKTFCAQLTEEQKISLFKSKSTTDKNIDSSVSSLLGANFSNNTNNIKTHSDFEFLQLNDDGTINLSELTEYALLEKYNDEDKYETRYNFGTNVIYDKDDVPIASVGHYKSNIEFENILTNETLLINHNFQIHKPNEEVNMVKIEYTKDDTKKKIYINSNTKTITFVENFSTDEYGNETLISVDYYKNNKKILKDNNENYILYNRDIKTATLDKKGKVIDYNGVEDLEEAISENNPQKFNDYMNKFVSNADIHQKNQLMQHYYNKTGRELLSDIKNANFIQDYEKEQYFKSIVGDFYDKKDIPRIGEKKSTQIKNELNTGDEYEITYFGSIMHIKNKTTNEFQRFDLNEIIETQPESKDMYKLLKTFGELPGEVIDDFSKEISLLQIIKSKDLAGVYTGAGSVGLKSRYIDVETIVHELGHAIDELQEYEKDFTGGTFKPDGKYRNLHGNIKYQTDNGEFNDLYEMLRDRYEANGNKSFYMKKYSSLQKYFTKDNLEGFAEFYAYYMLGEEYRSKKIIDDHFDEIKSAGISIIKNTKSSQQERRNAEHFYSLPTLERIQNIIEDSNRGYK